MKQNDRSVQNTVSSVMWNGFQWKSVHFYKVQRRCCPARRNFCVKGRYCCVTSGGWIMYRAVWPQWQTSALLLIFALFHWWPHHSHLPLHRSSVAPPTPRLCMVAYLDLDPQLLSWLHLHLSLIPCLWGLLPGISGLLHLWGLLPASPFMELIF